MNRNRLILLCMLMSAVVMPQGKAAQQVRAESQSATVGAAELTTTSQQQAVMVSATVQSQPPRITLTWPYDSSATNYTIRRKALESLTWGSSLVLAGNTTSYADSSVSVGVGYEYEVSKSTAGRGGVGYIYSGIELSAEEIRGIVILIVDNTYAQALAAELARLEQDLIGDGWRVLRHDVSRSASVASVKALIQADYAANPTQVQAVFLLGHVPVPYSGNFAPDGHSDHFGAWPADGFYGEMDGVWTDNTVDTTSAARPENHNIPGDGKFDTDYFPSNVELAVGRVDFYNLPQFSPQTELDLLRQYLNKDHNFRHGLVSVQQRGLVDGYPDWEDNGYAANGWRGFAPFFGAANVVAADWFSTLANEGYLWGYGCGPGWYQGATGIGSTADFQAIDTKVVFSMLYGSYFGDWDSPDNFLRAALATPTYGLASMWAGAPMWVIHPMAMGKTIGDVTRLTQNAVYVQYTIGNGVMGTHIALMGDPTLRMTIVRPPTDAMATWGSSNTVELSWTPAPDTVVGYHVYRASNPNGPFSRLSQVPITSASFTDADPVAGAVYMVRAIKLQTTASGSYYDFSQGAFVTLSPSMVEVPLVAGWNFVSVPVQPADPAIAQVLASIAGKYSAVFSYNGCDTADPWKKYTPGAPPYTNDLTVLGFTQGFWINMLTQATLTLTGAPAVDPNIPLCVGWNMLGYPVSTPRTPAEALASVTGKYSMLVTYEATDPSNPWKRYDPAAPPFANTLMQMQAGHAYWLKVTVPCTWIPE